MLLLVMNWNLGFHLDENQNKIWKIKLNHRTQYDLWCGVSSDDKLNQSKNSSLRDSSLCRHLLSLKWYEFCPSDEHKEDILKNVSNQTVYGTHQLFGYWGSFKYLLCSTSTEERNSYNLRPSNRWVSIYEWTILYSNETLFNIKQIWPTATLATFFLTVKCVHTASLSTLCAWNRHQ